jgi:hypothetical protein
MSNSGYLPQRLFFLGAGFFLPAGLPLANQLLPIALQEVSRLTVPLFDYGAGKRMTNCSFQVHDVVEQERPFGEPNVLDIVSSRWLTDAQVVCERVPHGVQTLSDLLWGRFGRNLRPVRLDEPDEPPPAPLPSILSLLRGNESRLVRMKSQREKPLIRFSIIAAAVRLQPTFGSSSGAGSRKSKRRSATCMST